jgi:hypothetical protein
MSAQKSTTAKHEPGTSLPEAIDSGQLDWTSVLDMINGCRLVIRNGETVAVAPAADRSQASDGGRC